MNEVGQQPEVVYKETICFVGGDSVGKTTALLEIAAAHPNAKVRMIDFENKWRKIRDIYFSELKNLEVETVQDWDDVERAFAKFNKELGVGDWLLIDGLDKAWDIIQTEYDESKHGPNEWGWIKGKHNKDFIDVATSRASYHVAATAYAQPNASYNIEREKDERVKEELMLWAQIGFRPGGEKRNMSRFETVFALKAQLSPRRNMVTTFKDKGRPYLDNGKKGLWLNFDFPLWDVYKEAVDAALEEGRKVAPLS